eukprot:6073260-Amphidinium_carterae.3
MENLRKLDRHFGAHGMSPSPTVSVVSAEGQDEWSGAWGRDSLSVDPWWLEDESWPDWTQEEEGDWSQPYHESWDAWEGDGEPLVDAPLEEA